MKKSSKKEKMLTKKGKEGSYMEERTESLAERRKEGEKMPKKLTGTKEPMMMMRKGKKKVKKYEDGVGSVEQKEGNTKEMGKAKPMKAKGDLYGAQKEAMNERQNNTKKRIEGASKTVNNLTQAKQIGNAGYKKGTKKVKKYGGGENGVSAESAEDQYLEDLANRGVNLMSAKNQYDEQKIETLRNLGSQARRLMKNANKNRVKTNLRNLGETAGSGFKKGTKKVGAKKCDMGVKSCNGTKKFKKGTSGVSKCSHGAKKVSTKKVMVKKKVK